MVKKAKGSSTKSAAQKKLPPALARRAEQMVETKQKRLRAEATDLVELVRRKQVEITESFYDIGLALKRLKDREMLTILGHRTFVELCDKRFSISAALGERLVQVVEAIPRGRAITMGQTKAMAMVAIADATAVPDTPAGIYRRGRLRLPDGEVIDPRTMSAKGIERAAKTIRQARDTDKPRRGRTTTADERALVAKLEKLLRAAGLSRATAIAVATKPGQVSDFRIEHVPVDAFAVLAKALVRAVRG